MVAQITASHTDWSLLQVQLQHAPNQICNTHICKRLPCCRSTMVRSQRHLPLQQPTCFGLQLSPRRRLVNGRLLPSAWFRARQRDRTAALVQHIPQRLAAPVRHTMDWLPCQLEMYGMVPLECLSPLCPSTSQILHMAVILTTAAVLAGTRSAAGKPRRHSRGSWRCWRRQCRRCAARCMFRRPATCARCGVKAAVWPTLWCPISHHLPCTFCRHAGCLEVCALVL